MNVLAIKILIMDILLLLIQLVYIKSHTILQFVIIKGLMIGNGELLKSVRILIQEHEIDIFLMFLCYDLSYPIRQYSTSKVFIAHSLLLNICQWDTVNPSHKMIAFP